MAAQELDDDTAARIEVSLAQIDAAIAEIEAALEDNPGDRGLSRGLARAWQHKASVLARVMEG